MSNKLVFAQESPSNQDEGLAKDQGLGTWRLLIVDDDPGIHQVTKLALKRVVFRGRGLEMLSAHSAKEAKSLLSSHDDIAVVLLDVVMETEDAGLKLVHFIRQELQNKAIRIILRTGQPGQAPEEDIVLHYDINDYKAKTELTSRKLFITIISALRSYEDIRALEKNRRGLEQVIASTDSLMKQLSMRRFASGVLDQLSTFLNVGTKGVLCVQKGDPMANKPNDLFVLAGAGNCQGICGRDIAEDKVDEKVCRLVKQAFAEQAAIFEKEAAALYIGGENYEEYVAFLDTNGPPNPVAQDLVEVFCGKISVGFANISLYEQLKTTSANLEMRVLALTRELEETRRQLEDAAIKDSLTLAYNRNHLMDCGETEIARACRYSRPLSIMLWDIDNFRAFNQKYGHRAGDALLARLIEKVKNSLRQNDIIARYAGDQFAILLPESDLEKAGSMAVRIQEMLRDLVVSLIKNECDVTFSIGIANLKEEECFNQLVNRSEAALNIAKVNGGGIIQTG